MANSRLAQILMQPGSPLMGRMMQHPNVQQAMQGHGPAPQPMQALQGSSAPSQMAVNRVPGMAQPPMTGGMAPQSQGITPQMPIPGRSAGGPRFSGK
jgi:hypothetical protein